MYRLLISPLRLLVGVLGLIGLGLPAMRMM